MGDETEQQRITRATELAYEEGRRRQQVDGVLENHEKRLTAINGSIDRGTKATTDLRTDVRKLHELFAGFIADQRTRDEVEKYRAMERKDADEKRTEQVRQANEKQISRRDYALGVAVVVVMILGLIATVLTSTHVL